MSTTNHPFDVLAPELWQEIFVHCLPVEKCPDVNEAPLLLCSVSHSWKNLAVSTPRLWTSLSMVVGGNTSYLTAYYVAQWLNRSKALPLTLSLQQRYPFENTNFISQLILTHFMRHTARWQHVSLEFPTWQSVTVRQSIPDFGHPILLKSFTLDANQPRPDSAANAAQVLFDLVGIAPGISKLEVLSSIGAGVQLHSIGTAVTDIKLHNVDSVELCLNIITRCVALTTCDFRMDRHNRIGDLSKLDVLVHSNLRSMELHTQPTQISALLRLLELPALQHLGLYASCNTLAQTDFLDFLSRSKCKLLTLVLNDTGISSARFIDCLKHSSLKSLVELSVLENYSETWQPVITREVMELLTTGVANDTDLLPSLQQLSIEGYCMTCPVSHNSGLICIYLIAPIDSKSAGHD